METVTSSVTLHRGGGQFMDFTRIQAEMAGFTSTVQNAIGEVMNNGFGVETTPVTNQVILYGLIVFALFIGLRVRNVRSRGISLASADKYRRFGLDRYKQI